MNPKISYNPDNIHVWVNLADMPNLIDFCIRHGYLKEAAVCCQMLECARHDPAVEGFYKDGKEVLLEMSIDAEKKKLNVTSVAVSPDFVSEGD